MPLIKGSSGDITSCTETGLSLGPVCRTYVCGHRSFSFSLFVPGALPWYWTGPGNPGYHSDNVAIVGLPGKE